MRPTVTGEAPRLSLVVRAYNEAHALGRLLTGIAQQTVAPVEVVLVDSGSSDGTPALAARLAAELGLTLRLVTIAPEEFTFGRSLNRGIAAARAELIVIASAHVYPVYPDWLEHLIAPLADPQTAVSYGKQRGAPASHFSEHQIFAQWFPDQSVRRQETPFCNNANAAIRRSLWEETPYDESLSGLEDLAWARAAMDRGLGVAYAADAEIIHVHHETPAGVYNRYRREAMAFHRMFPHERFTLGDLLRLTSANLASDWLAAWRERQLGRRWAEIGWFRVMQFWGTYRGYRQGGPLTWGLRRTFYYPRGGGEAAPAARAVPPIQYPDP
jgi:glycosyltransferase involved in cell wall biosynthesis